MPSAVPFRAQPAEMHAEPPKPFSAMRMLGMIGSGAGALGAAAAELGLLNGAAPFDGWMAWSLIVGASAFTWMLGTIELRLLAIIDEMHKPLRW